MKVYQIILTDRRLLNKELPATFYSSVPSVMLTKENEELIHRIPQKIPHCVFVFSLKIGPTLDPAHEECDD